MHFPTHVWLGIVIVLRTRPSSLPLS